MPKEVKTDISDLSGKKTLNFEIIWTKVVFVTCGVKRAKAGGVLYNKI